MEFMDYCLPLEDTTPQGQADHSNLFHPNDEGEEILKLGTYPSPADLHGAAVPLEKAVSSKTLQKIAQGQRSGESRLLRQQDAHKRE